MSEDLHSITFQEISSLLEGIRCYRRNIQYDSWCQHISMIWSRILFTNAQAPLTKIVIGLLFFYLYYTKISHLIFEVIWYIQCTNWLSLVEGLRNKAAVMVLFGIWISSRRANKTRDETVRALGSAWSFFVLPHFVFLSSLRLKGLNVWSAGYPPAGNRRTRYPSWLINTLLTSHSLLNEVRDASDENT